MIIETKEHSYGADFLALKQGIETGIYPPSISLELCQLLHTSSFHEINKNTFTDNSLSTEYGITLSEFLINRIEGVQGKVLFEQSVALYEASPKDTKSLKIHSHPFDNKIVLEKLTNKPEIVAEDFDEKRKFPRGKIIDNAYRNKTASIDYPTISKDTFLKLNKSIIPKVEGVGENYGSLTTYRYTYYISYQPIPSADDILPIRLIASNMIDDHFGLISGNWFLIWKGNDKVKAIYNLTTGKKSGLNLSYTITGLQENERFFYIPDKFKDLEVRLNPEFQAYVFEQPTTYQWYNLYYDIISEELKPTGTNESGAIFNQHPNGYISLSAFQNYA